MPERYKQINLIIDYLKPASIVEIGTWNGNRAIDIASAALRHHAYVHYWGFDLFEHATVDHDQRALNVKPHIALKEVYAKLGRFKEDHPGLSFNLIRGDSRQTLHQPELPVWCLLVDHIRSAARAQLESEHAVLLVDKKNL